MNGTKAKRLAGLPEQIGHWMKLAPVQMGFKCAAAFFGALLLSSVPLGTRPLPLAASLVLALEFFPFGLLAALGSVAGAVLLWPWALALEPVAVTVLCYAAAGLFHDTGLRESERFAAILGLCLTAAVGFVFLLDQGFAAQNIAYFAAKLLLAAVAPPLFRRAVSQRKPAALWAAGLCLFLGLACLARPASVYLAVGFGYAAAVATGRIDMLPTLLCGLGLDLTAALPCAMSAPMAGAALLCRVLPRKRPVDCAVCFALVGAAWQLFCGVLSLPLLLACTLGSAAGLLVPPLRLPEHAPTVQPPAEAEQPLRKAAQVFASMYRALAGIPPEQAGIEIADVYDGAAETVCHHCVRHCLCWEQNAAQTYADLCEAAAPMLQRGCAVREDFPPRFVDGCCHMEGFLTAVNQELERRRSRSQLRNRLQESRRVLVSQYLFLSHFLGRLADEPPQKPRRPAFTPEFAVSSSCKPGERVCGDRGASFRDRWNHFYVLLCDGMGSGSPAARKSGQAVHTLAGLLEAGVAPDVALEMLNGFYILQEDSTFSTVDLLQVDLVTGSGVLYKWGAAPSYLKAGERVETLGVPAPPPGVDMAQFPAQRRLSLKEGQTLIMVSDGAFSERTRKRAETFRGSGAKELAKFLTAGEETDDDRTAAVVRLIAS